jgi:hypothetical protein
MLLIQISLDNKLVMATGATYSNFFGSNAGQDQQVLNSQILY